MRTSRRECRSPSREGGVSVEQLAILATVAIGVAVAFAAVGDTVSGALIGTDGGGAHAASAPPTGAGVDGPGLHPGGYWVDGYGRPIHTSFSDGESGGWPAGGGLGGDEPIATTSSASGSSADGSGRDAASAAASGLSVGDGRSTDSAAGDSSATGSPFAAGSDPSGGPGRGASGAGAPTADGSDPFGGPGDGDGPGIGDPIPGDDPIGSGGAPAIGDPIGGDGSEHGDREDDGDGDRSDGESGDDRDSDGDSGEGRDPADGAGRDPRDPRPATEPGEGESGTSAGGPRQLPVIVGKPRCKEGWRGTACRAMERAKDWYDGAARRGREWGKEKYDQWAEWANESWGPGVRKWAPWVFGWPLLGAEALYGKFHGWASEKSIDLQNWVNRQSENVVCPPGPLGGACHAAKAAANYGANVVLPFQRGVMDWANNTLGAAADLWRLPINIATGDPATKEHVDRYFDDPIGYGTEFAKSAASAVWGEVKNVWSVCVTDHDTSACAQAVGTLAPDVALAFVPGGAAFKAVQAARRARQLTHTTTRAQAFQHAQNWMDRHGRSMDSRNPKYIFLSDEELFGERGGQPFNHQGPPGYASVVVHGAPNGFFIPDARGRPMFVTPHELAQALRARGFASDRPIELVSCHAGACTALSANAAQQLADELGVPVVAANTTVYPDGNGVVARDGRKGPHGEWSVYIPNGAVASVPE
jgi:hypothetical protein